ncbi:hypothetical protein GE09DRAFT_1267933 [Coniochaeta sp. 2T2.1]|nr:hypothetical protein GE09DRAFT_1267933 [Coniochaeta sp. 2T2.1]
MSGYSSYGFLDLAAKHTTSFEAPVLEARDPSTFPKREVHTATDASSAPASGGSAQSGPYSAAGFHSEASHNNNNNIDHDEPAYTVKGFQGKLHHQAMALIPRPPGQVIHLPRLRLPDIPPLPPPPPLPPLPPHPPPPPQTTMAYPPHFWRDDSGLRMVRDWRGDEYPERRVDVGHHGCASPTRREEKTARSVWQEEDEEEEAEGQL